MDKQEFGRSEELLQFRETPLPQPVEAHFAMREGDLVEAGLANLRMRRWNLMLGLMCTMGVLLILMDRMFQGLFVIFFLVPFKLAFVGKIRKLYRKEPMFGEPMSWTFGEDEITLDHPRTSGRQQWSVYKKIVETDNLFLLYPQETIYNIIPKRGFADEAEMERFRELCRANGHLMRR